MTINTSKLSFVSKYPVDQIFQFISGSVTVSNAKPDSDTNITTLNMRGTLPTGERTAAYYDGTYSIDNDPTQNRISSKNGAASLGPGISCYGFIRNSTGQDVALYVHAFISNAQPYPDNNVHTVHYNFVVFGSNTTTGFVTPSIPNTIQKYFDSRVRYQSIFLQDSVSVTLSSTAIANIPISHNLGYIPVVKAYFVYFNNATGHLLVDLLDAVYVLTSVDENKVTFIFDNLLWGLFNGTSVQSGAIEYRIYRQ